MSAKEQTDTPTPRTDEVAEIRIVKGKPLKIVTADFARQLETELTALQADVRRLVEASLNLVKIARANTDDTDQWEKAISDVESTANNPSLKPENDQPEARP